LFHLLQVEGKNGVSALGTKLKAGGPRVLYHGALAASAATFVGHYPWFATVSSNSVADGDTITHDGMSGCDWSWA
jgi:hypothetical protein